MPVRLDDEYTASDGTLTYVGATPTNALTERIPVDTSKRYVARLLGQNLANDPVHDVGVAFYNFSGNLLRGDVSPATSDATGWTAVGEYHLIVDSGTFSTGSPTLYSIDFGSGGTASIPTGAVTMALVWRTNVTGIGNASAAIEDACIYEYNATRHDPDDESTWQWSDNPSVVMADYLRKFMGVEDDEIDWESAIYAANFCDQLVDIPGAATEKRFTCNGALSLGDSHSDNLEAILSSMGGHLAWSNGRWKWRASSWAQPTATIDGDWLTEESVEGVGYVGRKERFNVVEGFYVDPQRKHEAVEFMPVSTPAYVDRDGETISKSLELPMTNSEWMAQRLAYRLLEQGNNLTTVKLKLNDRAATLGIHDRVQVDLPPLGWTNSGNLIKYSDRRATSPWYNGNIAVTESAEVGPFASMDANRVEVNGVGIAYLGQQLQNAGSGNGLTYAIWAKAGSADDEGNRFRLINTSASPTTDLFVAEIDYSNGNLTLTGDARSRGHVVEHPNGWWRLIVNVLDGSISTDDLILYEGFVNETASIGQYCYLKGSQLLPYITDNPQYVPTEDQTLQTTPKNMRVIEWSANNDATYQVTLITDDGGDYVDPVVAEYTDVDAPQIDAPEIVVPPPSNLTATGVVGGVSLAWTDPPSRLYKRIQIWASHENDRSTAELEASVSGSPLVDNFSAIYRKRWYWIRAVGYGDKVSEWHPSSSTAGVGAFPLYLDFPLLPDPEIRGDLTEWDLTEGEWGVGDQNVTLVSGGGVGGSNAIQFIQPTSGAYGYIMGASRRGPRLWDAESPGDFNVQISWRWALGDTSPGGSHSYALYGAVWIEDEDGSNREIYREIGNRYITNGSTVGEWVDDTVIVPIQESAVSPEVGSPRYIRVGIAVPQVGIANIKYDLERVTAKIVPGVFAGSDRAGFVPNPGSSTGRYLKDDGTWDTPA